jgi:hypothetical protein
MQGVLKFCVIDGICDWRRGMSMKAAVDFYNSMYEEVSRAHEHGKEELDRLLGPAVRS